MGGMYGTGEAAKIAGQLGSILSIGFRVLKGNFFAGFELVGPINALRDVNLELFKSEILELDEAERHVVEEAFKSHVDLSDKAIQAKVLETVDLLDEVAALVQSAFGLFESAGSVVGQFRKMLGV